MDSAIARAADQATRCTAKLSLGQEHGFTGSGYIKAHEKSWSNLECDVDHAHFAVIYAQSGLVVCAPACDRCGRSHGDV